jgi:hypothetical protein
MAAAASLQVPVAAYRFGVELTPAEAAAAHGIGSGERCWSGPTAWSPGAASAGPPTHHRAGGRLPRRAERARVGAEAPRRCARCREVFALVQAHRGVGAPCCAEELATGSKQPEVPPVSMQPPATRGHRRPPAAQPGGRAAAPLPAGPARRGRPAAALDAQLRIDHLHREADQARLARLARRHRRRVAVPPRRAAVPGRCPAPSRPAHQARSA